MYRDVNNPNAVVIHTRVDDIDRARQWFQSEASHEVTFGATIRGRDISFVERLDRSANVRAIKA